ncbi:hypothetical protein GCM10009867_35020 [Pedococcus aerophilus]|uniref:Uncharacterized protein n=1 Tax=Pedococcus aerophilus TaxID=436356 RepID=A0ABP6HAY5_9MICO
MNFVTAIPMFAARAAKIAVVPPSADMAATVIGGRWFRSGPGATPDHSGD